MAWDHINKPTSPRLKDLTGKVFGLLTVIKRGPNTKQGKAQWECQCSKCGTIKTIVASSLIHGFTTSCGRCTSKETGRRKTIDLTNQKFGRLLVIARAGSSLRGRALWQCRCECDGSIVIVLGKELRSGNTVSCGCWKAERMGDFARTHGMGLTREYKAWKAAKQRCTNPKDKGYQYYGGRGIQMCEEWMDSFPDFYAHIGPRPQGQSLDRIDVNGNYAPGNVRWATAKEQMNNRRCSRR